MSTPTPHTDVDLRLPDEDPTKDPTKDSAKASANAATKQSAESAGNPLDAISWPVRTDRLTLRPATRDDLEATWGFRRLDEIQPLADPAPATLEEYRPGFEDAASLAKTLIIEFDGQVIGDVMLQIEDGSAQGEVVDQGRGVHADLGWVLHPDHAGHGYATEAVRELIRLCFEDLGLRRVTANCFADNTASWRLMERVGMRRETYAVKESLHRSGEWLDTMGYALLSEKWSSDATRG